ncbi:MAG: DoxX family protein [Bauldia sp.]
MATPQNLALLAGRIFVSAIFIYDATLIARFPDENHSFIQSFGVPGSLLWPAALLQLAGGVMLLLGLGTRLAAIALATFCALTALIFHSNLGDVTEAIQFGKDFGLAGGFLCLAAAGAGGWSLDARLGTDFWPVGRR